MIQWDWDVWKDTQTKPKHQLKIISTFYCHCLKNGRRIEEAQKRWASQITWNSRKMACIATINGFWKIEHGAIRYMCVCVWHIKCSVILNELILFWMCIFWKETSQCDWYEHLIKFSFPFLLFILCHRFKYAFQLPFQRFPPLLDEVWFADFSHDWKEKKRRRKFSLVSLIRFWLLLWYWWVWTWRKYAWK